MIAGTGFPAYNDLIRDDQGQDAGFGIDYVYETWAAADLLSRFLAGEKGVPGGVGVQVYDRDHGVPSCSDTAPITDFKERYTTIWQVRDHRPGDARPRGPFGAATVALAAEGVCKTYGATKALDDVSLTVTSGAIHGLNLGGPRRDPLCLLEDSGGEVALSERGQDRKVLCLGPFR